jgi:hypothetical protein
MSSPITVTGALKDVSGVANAGKVTFTLCNYGGNPPVLSGTALLAQVSQTAQAGADGLFSMAVWGNDQISPAGTYYQVDVVGANGSRISTAAYRFTGLGSIDLSSVSPLVSLPTASNLVSIAKVGFTGDYNDLVNKPAIDSNGNVTLFADWNTLTNKPSFSIVAFTGSYNDLLSRPVLPQTKAGVTGLVLTGYDASTGQFTTAADQTGTGGGGSSIWGGITGTLANQTDLQAALNAKANTSALAGVATSGSYTDLANKPTIPTPVTLKVNGVSNGSQSVLNLKQGTNVTLTDDGLGGVTIAATGSAGSQPVDLGITWNGVCPASTVLLRHPLPFAMSLPTNCAGSLLISEVAAFAQVTFTLYKNGVAFGTAIFSTGASTATFSTTATNFVPGDVLKILGGGDPNLANLGGCILGTR